MNEFDKRMAKKAAERRRDFWDDVCYWAVEVLSWAAVVVAILAVIWIA